MSASEIELAYDVVVLGAGPGGEDATNALLAAGLTVALVEPELLGGECFNWGCVPSKAMLRPGHAARSATRAPGAREGQNGTAIDAQAALAHRDEVVLHHDDREVVAGFEAAGASFWRGRGRLDGIRRVVVETDAGDVQLTARQAVIIATGSSPAVPSIPGLREAQPWTNREATSAPRAPERLTVIGSGPLGLEMAQAWKWLGSRQVVVLSRREALLPELEPYAGELVLAGLRESGVDVRFDVEVERVLRPTPGGEVTVDLNDGTSVVADELLVATGKVADTGDLGLHTVGIEGDGFIPIDGYVTAGETDWLYAIGDVAGRSLMTHEASYHARVAAAAISARSRGLDPPMATDADGQFIPQVVFTDPEVAAVGMTRAVAERDGIAARYVETDLGAVLGAQLHAKDYKGRASVLIDDEAEVMIGAAFVGQDVADMVHAATVAIAGRVPLSALRHAVPSFPTMSEVWVDLLGPPQ
ncbi:dihydrolipoyl dehydrogenase family protein [Aeromicrobium sp. CF3.5]|uniref:dihydrolipoyl dehydrogenase family protein n=1 Tax=Aeromicrobium sp. CF3.5 TaxID=3373078 RepID=UPI003EE809BB